MKGKNDYQLYREPVPSEYSLTEIISRSLLLAGEGTTGTGNSYRRREVLSITSRIKDIRL